MYNNTNEAVEKILLYKAKLIKNKKAYREYATEVLSEHKIKDPVEAFAMGAVDAMLYDMACSLDFTKQKGSVYDWSSHRMRRKIINILLRKT